MYSRTSSGGGAPQYVAQYPQYPPGSGAIMNPRSPAPNTNTYRPPYSTGSPYQNGIASPSTTSGKPTSRPQQVSPKRSSSQSTTPPQQPRYQTPYPTYSNGPVAYKPGGSNGYGPPPTQQQQQQQQQSSWPPQPVQRDVVTPGLGSSAGDSDSNSSNASQQPTSYPPTTMTNGPTAGGYPQQPLPSSYNTGNNLNDSTNATMNTSGHPYMDPQYSNMPASNYGYPQQQMSKSCLY